MCDSFFFEQFNCFSFHFDIFFFDLFFMDIVYICDKRLCNIMSEINEQASSSPTYPRVCWNNHMRNVHFFSQLSTVQRTRSTKSHEGKIPWVVTPAYGYES